MPAGLTAIEPGDKGYRQVRSTYVHSGRPALVLRPESDKQVIEALDFARTQDVPIAVRSAGHGISGRSTNDGGIVIDVGSLNEVEVLRGTRVRIGPGRAVGSRGDRAWQARPRDELG
nr:FAD-binding protein [Fodinicola acaciae]